MSPELVGDGSADDAAETFQLLSEKVGAKLRLDLTLNRSTAPAFLVEDMCRFVIVIRSDDHSDDRHLRLGQ